MNILKPYLVLKLENYNLKDTELSYLVNINCYNLKVKLIWSISSKIKKIMFLSFLLNLLWKNTFYYTQLIFIS